MDIQTFQTIVINYEDGGDKAKLVICESPDNNGYVEIIEGGEKVVFPKELVDVIVRSLAKFSH